MRLFWLKLESLVLAVEGWPARTLFTSLPGENVAFGGFLYSFGWMKLVQLGLHFASESPPSLPCGQEFVEVQARHRKEEKTQCDGVG